MCFVALVCSPVACGSLLSFACVCPSYHTAFRVVGIESVHGGCRAAAWFSRPFPDWRARWCVVVCLCPFLRWPSWIIPCCACGSSYNMRARAYLWAARRLWAHRSCVCFLVCSAFCGFSCCALCFGGPGYLVAFTHLPCLMAFASHTGQGRAGGDGRALLVAGVRLMLCFLPRSLRAFVPSPR